MLPGSVREAVLVVTVIGPIPNWDLSDLCNLLKPAKFVVL